MQSNQDTITAFYRAFQIKDAEGMARCYHPAIVFNDPAFGILEGEEVRDMWRMLCASAKDLHIEFGPVTLLDEEYAQCPWRARYTFSKTGRQVDNSIKAHMRLQDGLIIEHTDQFDLYAWTRMALGWKGWVLGWTNFMQGKIRSQAHRSLAQFQQKKQSQG